MNSCDGQELLAQPSWHVQCYDIIDAILLGLCSMWMCMIACLTEICMGKFAQQVNHSQAL